MPRDPEKQRAARQRYYHANRDVYRAKNARKRQRLHELVIEAKSVPCMDCGETFPPYVMDFDHRSDKQALVSQLPDQRGLRRLIEEMSKCDVVCSNCHRIRTAARRANGVPGPGPHSDEDPQMGFEL